MLRIEPVPVSPRLRGQRPLTPPAFGLRAPLGQATPCAGLARPQAAAPPLRGANALQASASFASALLCYPWIVQLSGALAVTVRCPP
uniref:Uncharacterized protein n=1 Tax=Escherichia coli TaxID=562 RepID=T2FKE3_ECOLX|nr:hypothetical protein [Escherichia coli]